MIDGRGRVQIMDFGLAAQVEALARAGRGGRRDVHSERPLERGGFTPAGAGLVAKKKVGRVRTCNLGLRGLKEEAAWIERYRQLWEARFDELDEVVAELKR